MSTERCRIVRATGLAAGALALALAPVAPALASVQGTVRVEAPSALPGQLTDTSGVLSAGEEASVRASLQQLAEERNIDLYVVLVKTFSGTDSRSWAKSTFSQSGMGPKGAVLAIATQDRSYAVAVGQDFPIGENERSQIATDDMAPELRRNEWANGIIALADGYREQSGGGSIGGLGGLGLGVAGVGVAGLGIGALVLARRRRSESDHDDHPAVAGRQPDQPTMSLEELDGLASRELVAADEDVRAAERDLGFAQAEFGDAALTKYVQAHGEAKQTLQQAFSLRQALDDAYPETDQQKYQMLTEIRDRCARTREVLQEQADDFARLRDLGRRAPEVLGQLRQRLTTLSGQLPQVAATVQSLTTRYSPPAVAPVAGAVDEVNQRVTIARQQLETAAGAKGTEAAVPLHTAEEALTQAVEIVARVDGLSGEIEAAASQLPQATNALSADVSGVSQADARTQQAVGAALAQARAALGYAESDGRSDPVGALKRVVEADGVLDKALAGAQVESDRSRRAAERLPQLLDHARRSLREAEDLISSNRGVVGSTARTRAAEARRVLGEAEAVSESDPVASFDLAQRAADLAGSALAEAQRDRDSARGMGGGFGGGGYRRGGLDPISVIIGASMGGWGHGGGGSWGGGGFGGGGGGFGGGGGGPFSGGGDAGRF